MAFCINCGQELAEGAKFCANCGKAANNTSTNQRKTVYDGELHKCPNCGELLKSFEIKCNVCGYELRNARAISSVKEFELKFEQTKSVDGKIDLIKTFAIPNVQEDLLEFAVLAAMNIDFDAYRVGSDNSDDIRLSNAWLAKLEQAHEKAQVLFDNTPIWEKINGMYEKRVNKLKEIKRKYNRDKCVGRIFGFIGTALKTIIGWAALFMILGGIFYLTGNKIVGYVLFGIGAYVGFFALIVAVSKNDKEGKK